MEKNVLKKISDYIFEISKSYRKDMRVPGRIYVDEKMLDMVVQDKSLDQVVNVATMPGIVDYSIAMPDMHQGYGMPVGGVAAFDIENEGVISPGAVGYDINCGVRLLRSDFKYEEIKDKIVDLANQIQRDVPSGLGRGVREKLSVGELEKVLKNGMKWSVEKGYADERDLDFVEANGCLEMADVSLCSDRAKQRGLDQVGTLGSGNHFLEMQKVEKVLDSKVAEAFGLFEDQICFMIHTGSRGFGHQVATDYIKMMMMVMKRYNIVLPDRELACAPFESEEGQMYFKAMACGANFAWANRQMITFRMREAVNRILKIKNLDIVYDVAHNMAKLEKYDGKELCVHRKGATRAFPAGHEELCEQYRKVGQPVLIPGTMGTASYVLVGLESAKESFYSSCHGAGRRMSRSKAKKFVFGADLRKELEQKGIVIRAQSNVGLAEEAPLAYKDVDNVVDIVDKAKLSKKVARLVPLAVIKG